MTTTYDKDGAYIEVTTDGVVHRRSIKWEDCVVSFPTSTKLKIDRTYINDSDQLVLVLTDESEITLSASDEITEHAALPTVHQNAPQLIATHAGEADPHTGYIKHSLATAVSDFLAASGANTYVKKTLAETLTLLGLDPLLDNSMADALHRHSELSASDGTPDRALVVDAAGKVGIGTASPGELLHVSGGNILLDNTQQIRFKDAGGTENNVLALTSATHTDELILGAGSGIDNLSLATGGTRRLFIDNTGNVGIGVTDPDTTLEVFNAGNQLKLSFDGTDNAIFAVDTAGVLTITPSGAAVDFASKNFTSVGTLNTHTIPGGTDTFAMLAATQTLTNKTLTSPNINEAVALSATASELNLLDLAGLTAGEFLVATGAAAAAWQSTGVVLTAPNIDGIVTNTGAALVLPAFQAGGAIDMNSNDINNVAAPGAAGDPLIKGTRHLIAEMPTLTTDKAWKGVGGVPAEVDWPAGGATLTVAETEVFNGNSPVAWTDLDLSGTVGSQATLVLLKAVFTASRPVAFRKNGDGDEFYNAIIPTDSGYGCAAARCQANIHCVFIVATDNAGIIEWISNAANACVLDIIAYIA